MAFVMKKKGFGFQQKVGIPVLNEDGTTTEHQIELTMRHMGRSEFTAMQAENIDREGKTGLDIDVEYIMRFVQGWKDVTDEAGKAMPFNEENVRVLLDNHPSAASAIVSAFTDAVVLGGARLKN